MMKYQLVIQWPTLAIDYDDLVAIESLLIENLSEANDVDGHDMGADQANIFIRTNDPGGVFNDIQHIIEGYGCWSEIQAAYRDLNGSEYVVIWPSNLNAFNVR